MNVSTKGLKDYLKYASIYRRISPKFKTDLIQMTVYRWMTGTTNKKDLSDILIRQAKQVLNKTT